ncbi:MAG: phosphodiesterase [Actinobacteria bacterium ADurb.Bin346]|nr:MAG: phosphodiesterase [Actinobacteria bacterium ADurb.Bin346]
MDREDALKLVKKNVTNKNLFKHCLAVEAIMKATAIKLNSKTVEGQNAASLNDPDRWAMAGLVHDIDYDSTADKPEEHSLKGAEMLKEHGFDEDIIYAVKAHNEIHGLPLKSQMDIALCAADPLSGLIVAAALINPEKKLSAIDSRFVLNRFREKLFAKGAKREQIMKCEALGLDIEEFIETGLASMQEIAEEIGL